MDVIVHGGAGSVPDAPERRQAALEAAVTAGAAERRPLDAVEVALRALEHDPQFNAGTGGSVQSDGIPRTEAGVMTSDREAGAACAMPGVEHAVSVARVVHEETPHVLLSGVHAVDLADAFDVAVEVDLWAERTRTRWDALGAPPRPTEVQVAWVNDRWAREGATGGDEPDPRGTIGAVARQDDRIAAAASTGGRWGALAGRVGDASQVGSGFYATPAAGASATGAGEGGARTTLARRAVDLVGEGADATAAAETAIDEFDDLAGGHAGLVVADSDGGLGSAFDSPAMQVATVRR